MVHPSDPTWVDAKAAQREVANLLDVIVEMASAGGEDMFPIEPGAYWFDAVKRYDPVLATKLADPDRAGFPYRMTIFDIASNRSIMHEASMTDVGVDAMLLLFKSQDPWKADFLHTLHRESYAERRSVWIDGRPQILKVWVVDPSAEEK